jgi:hypothetical protein
MSALGQEGIRAGQSVLKAFGRNLVERHGGMFVPLINSLWQVCGDPGIEQNVTKGIRKAAS